MFSALLFRAPLLALLFRDPLFSALLFGGMVFWCVVSPSLAPVHG